MENAILLLAEFVFVPWQKCSSWKNQVNFNRVILLCIFHSRHTRRCRNNETNRKIKDCKSKRNCAESAKKFQRWRAHPFSALFYACQRFHRIIVIELLSWKLKLRQNCASFFFCCILGKWKILFSRFSLAARCSVQFFRHNFHFPILRHRSFEQNKKLSVEMEKSITRSKREEISNFYVGQSSSENATKIFHLIYLLQFQQNYFFVYRLNRHLHCY